MLDVAPRQGAATHRVLGVLPASSYTLAHHAWNWTTHASSLSLNAVQACFCVTSPEGFNALGAFWLSLSLMNLHARSGFSL